MVSHSGASAAVHALRVNLRGEFEPVYALRTAFLGGFYRVQRGRGGKLVVFLDLYRMELKFNVY